jgi:hypothetical protein
MLAISASTKLQELLAMVILPRKRAFLFFASFAGNSLKTHIAYLQGLARKASLIADSPLEGSEEGCLHKQIN